MFQHTPGLDQSLIFDFAIYDHAVGSDSRVASDTGVASQLNEGLNDSVWSNFDVAVNHTSFREKDGHAFGHQLPAFGQPHVMVYFSQIGTGVATENLVGIAGLHCDHALFGLAENRSHIGEIELTMVIVRVEFVDVAEKRLRIKSVEAGVDFLDFLLGGGKILLFNNGLDIIAEANPDSHSFAGGLFVKTGARDETPATHGVSHFLEHMMFNGLGRDQGSVAGKHDYHIVGSQRLTRDHEGVSGTSLFALQNESDACVGHRGANSIGFMADDGIDIAGRNYLGGGCDYVRQQRLAADFVQHFGMLRFQAGPFACCHDRDGYAGLAVMFRFRHLIQYTARS